MSFLQQLKNKRAKLKETTTIVTTSTGEKFIENQSDPSQNIKLNERSHGFVVDTKPDKTPSCILNDFLFLGSQDAVCLENIIEYKITHVLSIGVEIPNLQALDVKNMFIPCLDLPTTDLFNGIIETSVKFIQSARGEGSRILVHCNAGISRSASIILAYLMLEYGMSYEAALTLVKTKRECIQPNIGFVRQLKNMSKSE